LDIPVDREPLPYWQKSNQNDSPARESDHD
jgi:hypothetical protein